MKRPSMDSLIEEHRCTKNIESDDDDTNRFVPSSSSSAHTSPPLRTVQMNAKEFQKMLFIANAVENGWSVVKTALASDGGAIESYLFRKKHHGKVKEYKKNYLSTFLTAHGISARSSVLSSHPEPK